MNQTKRDELRRLALEHRRARATNGDMGFDEMDIAPADVLALLDALDEAAALLTEWVERIDIPEGAPLLKLQRQTQDWLIAPYLEAIEARQALDETAPAGEEGDE